MVPVEVREIPLLGGGQKGVFALQSIPAQTKNWAWTDHIEKIHHSQLTEYISHNFSKGSEGELDWEAVRIFLRQGFVLPRPLQSDGNSNNAEGDVHDYPDAYFYSNPTDAGRFMNHSNNPNCGPDGTLRDIGEGEEFTMDYVPRRSILVQRYLRSV